MDELDRQFAAAQASLDQSMAAMRARYAAEEAVMNRGMALTAAAGKWCLAGIALAIAGIILQIAGAAVPGAAVLVAGLCCSGVGMVLLLVSHRVTAPVRGRYR